MTAERTYRRTPVGGARWTQTDSKGSAKRSEWTPELRMQRSKERVTALLAFLLVASTMALTYRTFSMAGQDGKMKDAMGVLSLLFGLAGVVVGYYFGRIPGDARAVESHQTTQMAMETMRDMSGASGTANQMAEKTREIQANLDADIDRAKRTHAKLAAGDPVDDDEIQQLANSILRLQQEMSELQRMAPR
jgi:hypothetical protein